MCGDSEVFRQANCSTWQISDLFTPSSSPFFTYEMNKGSSDALCVCANTTYLISYSDSATHSAVSLIAITSSESL